MNHGKSPDNLGGSPDGGLILNIRFRDICRRSLKSSKIWPNFACFGN